MGWLISSMCFQNAYKFFYVIAFFSVKEFLYFYHLTKKRNTLFSNSLPLFRILNSGNDYNSVYGGT